MAAPHLRIDRKRHLHAAALLFAFTAVSVAAQEAAACSCEPHTTQEIFELSNAVFHGRVERTCAASAGPACYGDSSAGDFEAKEFSVLRSWKGEATATKVVFNPDSTCGMAFREGEEWLVFTHAPNTTTCSSDELLTGLCMGTQRIETAAAVLEELGEPRDVFDADDASDEASACDDDEPGELGPAVKPGQPGTRGCNASGGVPLILPVLAVLMGSGTRRSRRR